jgi:methionine aminotransferase
VRRLIREAGVAAIPLSAFYEQPPKDQRLLRFCFCKSDAVLTDAVQRLQAYYQSSGSNRRAALDAV